MSSLSETETCQSQKLGWQQFSTQNCECDAWDFWPVRNRHILIYSGSLELISDFSPESEDILHDYSMSADFGDSPCATTLIADTCSTHQRKDVSVFSGTPGTHKHTTPGPFWLAGYYLMYYNYCRVWRIFLSSSNLLIHENGPGSAQCTKLIR